jgi:hypothetical protein
MREKLPWKLHQSLLQSGEMESVQEVGSIIVNLSNGHAEMQ